MMKNKKFFLVTILALVCAICLTAFTACKVRDDDSGSGSGDPETPHVHTLVKHDESQSTCTVQGTKAYWQCSECKLFFSDENGTTQIEEPEKLPLEQHSFTVWQNNETEHWHKCENCDATETHEKHSDAGEFIIITEEQPTKKSYFAGEKFDPKGLKVVEECYASCGYSRDITKDIVIENADAPLTAGMTSVKAKYGEKEIIIGITVNEIVAVSLSAKLKDGVVYYANGLAIPKAADFVVTAEYNDKSSKTLSESEYTVSAATGFDVNGGVITISLNGVNNVKTEINYELVKVQLEKLEVKTNPTNTTFRAGEAITLEGLVLLAINNDGSKVEITKGYTCEEEGKTYAEEGTVTAVVSYTAGGVTKTVTITLTITNSDGAVTALAFEEGAVFAIYAGENFDIDSVTILAVYAVYESGKKELLTADDYIIALPEGRAVMGNKYFVTATFGENGKISVKLPVKVLAKVNGEDYTDMAGGSLNKDKTAPEKEYVIGEDGTITETDRVVPWVGGFSKTAEAGGNAFVTWTVTSSSSAAASVTLRAANSYLKKTDGGYIMDALQVNSVADLYVNGEKVAIPDSVVLKGCGPAEKYAPLYNIYYMFEIDGLMLAAGANQIKLVWKASTLNQKNCWNETPSTMNIDYIEVATYGSVNDGSSATVQSVIVERKTPEYGEDFEAYKASYRYVLGVMSDGSRKLFGSEEISVTLTGDQTKDYFGFGNYTIAVALKNAPEIKDEWTANIEEFTEFYAYGASVEVKENKAYWVLIFACVNDEEYSASDFTVFDGSKTATVTFVERTARYLYLYMDVTERTETGDFYVHAKIKGVNYDNGEHKNNGDFKETSINGKISSTLVFPQTSVTLDGRKYTVRKQYNMAIFGISNAS